MPATMTSLAQDRGARNALICASLVLVLAMPICALILATTSMGIVDALVVTLAILLVPNLIIWGMWWVRGRSRRGEILLDCGPIPSARLAIAYGVVMVAGCWAQGALAAVDHRTGMAIAMGIMGLTGIMFVLAGATGRLQFCERGIWVYWGLFRWDRIGTWRIDSHTLLTESRRVVLGYRGKSAIPIPPELRAEIEAIMLEFCGNPTGRAVPEPEHDPWVEGMLESR